MSIKRQIGLGAFISFLFFALAFGIFFWFMMRPYKYEGEHPNLYTVAVNNVFGAWGYMSNGEAVYDPDIEVIEKDSYGRVLFFYDERFSFGTALVIMQASDENEVSYYLDHCYYPYMYSEDSPYDATYRDLFTEKEISDLKKLNDWNKPINGEKCTSSPIVSCFKQPNSVNSASENESSSMMGTAPCTMSLFAPCDEGDVIAPGTTNTSLFAAKASSAVENVPDGKPASTIRVARAKPAMSRFLNRKVYG